MIGKPERPMSALREQLDAAQRETDSWPAWKKMEVEAEIRRTPLKNAAHDGKSQ